MKGILKLISVILVLSLLSLPVLGQMGMRGGDMMRAKEMMRTGSEYRSAGGMMGMGFMHRDGTSYGSYVTFSVDNVTGDVLNYGISGVNVFDSIKVPGIGLKDISTRGAVTFVDKNGSVFIQLHDNPAAVINIAARKKATMVFDLSDGVNAVKENNIVNVSVDNITAYIVSANATSISIAGGEVKIEIDSGFTIFRATPVNMPPGMMNRGYMGGFMKRRAGAEISIGNADKSSIVNYSDGMNAMIRSMQRDRMRLILNSSDPSGKFIMVNIDNSSLTWNERQKIRMYLDNRPMRQVMTEQELYNATESCYWLRMTGGNGMEAVMYIANFSERQVDIVVEDEVTPAATPEIKETTISATPGAPGFEILMVLLGTAAAYRLRRKT